MIMVEFLGLLFHLIPSLMRYEILSSINFWLNIKIYWKIIKEDIRVKIMTLVLLFIITLMDYLFLVKIVTLGKKIQKKVVTTM